jgi:polysaccharide biosynthesis/export protein
MIILQKINSLQLRTLLLLCLLFSVSSCKLFFPYLMLQTPSDYPFAVPDSSHQEAYVIQPFDQLQLTVVANNGYQLIDITVSLTGNSTSGGGGGQSAYSIPYEVRQSGLVKLPILDTVQLAGLTVVQAEARLTTMYAPYFVNPFVKLVVSSSRVIVFVGQGGAHVIELKTNNTNLLEVLAEAGGIPPESKAYNIKLIRGDLKKPTIYKIDLSTVKGMEEANLLVKPNDIIYVQPTTGIGDAFVKVTPIISIITLAFTTITLIFRQ